MNELTTEEKQVKKNKILSDLFKQGELQKKIEGICHRNFIQKHTNIHEDILQETFLHLSKFNTDTLIEMYDDNPSRILGLGVTIAVRKGVSKDNKYPEYPKHSLAQMILFASNLKSNNSISETDDIDASEGYLYQIIDESTLPETGLNVWQLIKAELSEKDNQFLDKLIALKKGRGRYKESFIAERKQLFETIKSIITKHKINI